MRALGYVLIGLGFAAAFLWNYLGRDNVWIMAVGALSILAGMVLLAANAIARMSRGELQLRPFNALKLFPVLLIALLAVTFGLRLIMPSNFSAMESAWLAFFMAAFFSIYSTLYRKPA